MTKRFLSALLVLTFSLSWSSPVLGLRSGQPQEQEKAGLEELQAHLFAPAPAPQTPFVLAGLEEEIEGWATFTPAEQEALRMELSAIQAQSDLPLAALAEYARNPDGVHAQQRQLPNLTTAAFSAPPTVNLLEGVPDWFFDVVPAEKKVLRELLEGTMILLASGGGGKRFKGGVRLVPDYRGDLDKEGRFEKPTARVHLSGKSPEVRFLEGLDRIARLLDAKPTVVLVDSPETQEAVTHDLNNDAPWLGSSPIRLERTGTMVYPSFDLGSKKILTFRDKDNQQPHIVTSANGTFGVLQAAWEKLREPHLQGLRKSTRRYLVVYGDDPALSTPPFLISALRQTRESQKKSGQEPDLLAIATTKNAQDNPKGGTLVDATIGGKRWHLLLQPGERSASLDATEKAPFFPFDTGTYYLSGRFMEAAIEQGVPLRNSQRPLELPQGEVKAFLPEKYLTRVIDLVNDPSLNFSFEVAVVPLDDGIHLSAYRAVKQYRDEQFGIQGVVDASRTLGIRDEGILRRVFEAQRASKRLRLDPKAAVEISPRVSAIRIGPRGKLTVGGGVGIEFAHEGVRARKFLGEYSPGHPRFSRDFVEILPAKEGAIAIDQPLTVTSETVRHLSAGLEEPLSVNVAPTWNHFQLDRSPDGKNTLKIDLKNTKIFLPLRGPEHTKRDDPEAVYTVDDLLVTAKTIRVLNDYGVGKDRIYLLVDPGEKVIEEFNSRTDGLDLKFTLLQVGQYGKLSDPSSEAELQEGNWTPTFVEPFSRLGGFRAPVEELGLVEQYTNSAKPTLMIGVRGFTDFTQVLVPEGTPLEVIDLHPEWRWPDYFSPLNRQGLIGFLYDSNMLTLADQAASQNRDTRWEDALKQANNWLQKQGQPGVSPLILPPEAYRIFYETLPSRIQPVQSPGDIKRLIDVVDQALAGKSAEERHLYLFASYDPHDPVHEELVKWHLSQGHQWIDASGAWSPAAPRGPPAEKLPVTVVNLPLLPLPIQRRLMAASDLVVAANEHTFADALLLAYRGPETAPLLFYAGIDPARMAPLGGPVAFRTSPGAVETFQDLVAFEELLNDRTTPNEKSRLAKLINDPKERVRYLTDIGAVVLVNGKTDVGRIERTGDPLLVNGLNVISRIIQKYDGGWDPLKILREPGTSGAAALYRASGAGDGVFQSEAAQAPQGWAKFEAAQGKVSKGDREEIILYFSQRGKRVKNPSHLAAQEKGYQAVSQAVSISQQGLPAIERIRQITQDHPLSDDEKAPARILGGGGSFRAYRLPDADTEAVLKYRYIHYAPFAGRILGKSLIFELRDRYHTLRNTIRAPLRLGDFAVPQQAYVTQELMEIIQKTWPKQYPELQAYVEMGLLKVIDGPLQVHFKGKRRGLNADTMPVEDRKGELHFFVIQSEVESLNTRLTALVENGKIPEAERWIDRYFNFVTELWRHGVYVSDMGFTAIAVGKDNRLRVFDLGGLPPLQLDARLPDLNFLDYPKPIWGELGTHLLEKKIPDEFKMIQDGLIKKIKKGTILPGVSGDMVDSRVKELLDYFKMQVGSQGYLTPEKLMEVWGQARTEIEQTHLEAIKEALGGELAEAELIIKEKLGTDPIAVQTRLDAARKLRNLVPAGIDPARVEVDLQLHTMHSDGRPTPTAVVYEAYRRGLKAIAITDHFTLAGILEAMEAGKIFGVEVIPGVEVDTTTDGVEILGYFLGLTEPEQVERFMQSGKYQRIQDTQQAEILRAQAIFDEINDTLGKHGYPLDEKDVQSSARGGPVLPGNVYEAFKSRYGKEVKPLVKEFSDGGKFKYWEGAGLIKNIKAIYEKYDRAPERVIQHLRSIGAVPVLAHPAEVFSKAGWDEETLASNLAAWSQPEVGLQGIEINSSKSDPGQMVQFPRLLEQHNRAHPDRPLIGTVGSDSHGYPNRVLGVGEVSATSPEGNLVSELGTSAVVEALKAAGLKKPMSGVPQAVLDGLMKQATTGLEESFGAVIRPQLEQVLTTTLRNMGTSLIEEDPHYAGTQARIRETFEHWRQEFAPLNIAEELALFTAEQNLILHLGRERKDPELVSRVVQALEEFWKDNPELLNRLHPLVRTLFSSSLGNAYLWRALLQEGVVAQDEWRLDLKKAEYLHRKALLELKAGTGDAIPPALVKLMEDAILEIGRKLQGQGPAAGLEEFSQESLVSVIRTLNNNPTADAFGQLEKWLGAPQLPKAIEDRAGEMASLSTDLADRGSLELATAAQGVLRALLSHPVLQNRLDPQRIVSVSMRNLSVNQGFVDLEDWDPEPSALSQAAHRTLVAMAAVDRFYEEVVKAVPELVSLLVHDSEDVPGVAADTLLALLDHDRFHEVLKAEVPRVVGFLSHKNFLLSDYRAVYRVLRGLIKHKYFHDALSSTRLVQALVSDLSFYLATVRSFAHEILNDLIDQEHFRGVLAPETTRIILATQANLTYVSPIAPKAYANADLHRAAQETLVALAKHEQFHSPLKPDSTAGLEGLDKLGLLPPADVIIADLDGTAAVNAQADVEQNVVGKIRDWLGANSGRQFIFLSTRDPEFVRGRIGDLADLAQQHPSRVLLYGYSGGSDPKVLPKVSRRTRNNSTIFSFENLLAALQEAVKIDNNWPGAAAVSKYNDGPPNVVAQFKDFDPKSANDQQKQDWKQNAGVPVFAWTEPANPGYTIYQFGPLSVYVPGDPGGLHMAKLSYGTAKGFKMIEQDAVLDNLKKLRNALSGVQGLQGAKIGEPPATGTTINLEVFTKADFLREILIPELLKAGKKQILYLDDEGQSPGQSGYRALLLGSDPDPKLSSLTTVVVRPDVHEELKQAAEKVGSRILIAPEREKGPAVLVKVLDIEDAKRSGPAVGLEEGVPEVATALESVPVLAPIPLKGAADFSDLGGTAAPSLRLAGEAFLEQEGVLEAIEVGGGVLSLGAEAATLLYGAPATAAILVRSDASLARVGPSAALGLGRIILADKDIPVRENWPWVKVGDWPELRQALLSADPRDYLFVEEEPGLTRGVVEAALKEAFPQGRMPLALLGSAEAYSTLPDNALDLLGRAGQPPVVVLRVEMELKSRSGETFHLIIMV